MSCKSYNKVRLFVAQANIESETEFIVSNKKSDVSHIDENISATSKEKSQVIAIIKSLKLLRMQMTERKMLVTEKVVL